MSPKYIINVSEKYTFLNFSSFCVHTVVAGQYTAVRYLVTNSVENGGREIRISVSFLKAYALQFFSRIIVMN